MNLLDWFPQQRMKTKRDEIKELILKLQTQQQLNLQSSHGPCEDTLQSADLIPPISSWAPPTLLRFHHHMTYKHYKPIRA